MASLDFPSNPVNNQTYSLNGVTYYYNSAIGAWLTQLSGMNIASSSNTQVLFNDANVANGSSGMVFNKSTNTLDLSGSNSSIIFPKGTTAQRPSSPSIGMIRYNTETDALENYTSGSGWIKVAVQVPIVITATGSIYSGAVSNVSFTGSGYGSSQATITFTSGATVATSNAVPTSGGTQLTAPVPSSIYALSASSVVIVKITNSDGGVSGNTSYTVIGLPTGGTITTSGTSRIHTFNSSSSLVVPTGFSATANYLIVAGGGGGGNGNASYDGNGGGGAGGLLTGTYSIAASTTYTATVGSGGAGGAVGSNAGTNGGNSSIFGFTATGGGGGGTDSGVVGSGGSGGGASCYGSIFRSGGSGTAGQGNAGGGANGGGSPGGGGGGGGGAGAVGATGQGSNTNGGAGGAGLQSSISGTSYYYAGGGGGSSWSNNGGAGGLGGGGGGGSNPATAGAGGGSAINSGSSGSGKSGGAGGTNTGGGAGAGVAGGSAGTGGSGVVIVSYTLA